METLITTILVIAHALFWAAMEVQMEGTRGWMYDSSTQCSGIFSWTWYHIWMNAIGILTVGSWVRHIKAFPYFLVLWFVLEDVGWFMMNGMTYRTAPWQSEELAIASSIVPIVLLGLLRPKGVSFYVNIIILIMFIIYIWVPFGKPFSELESAFMPRRTYCE